MTLDEIFECTSIDPWFLNQLKELHQAEQWIKAQPLDSISAENFTEIKRRGFSDLQVARLTGMYRPGRTSILAADGNCLSRIT